MLGRIPDPFVDINERAVQWVGEKVWQYRVEFPAPESFNTGASVSTDLVFEGLDTFATVILNGKKILKTDNMFVSYRVDISEHMLRERNNVLQIDFDSAWVRAGSWLKSTAMSTISLSDRPKPVEWQSGKPSTTGVGIGVPSS